MQTGVDSRNLPPIPCRSLNEIKSSTSIGNIPVTGGPIYPQVLKETRVAYQRRNMSKTKVKGIVKVSYFYLYLILIVTKLNL